MTTGDGSSPSPASLSVYHHVASKWRHHFCPILGQMAWHHPVPSWVVPGRMDRTVVFTSMHIYQFRLVWFRFLMAVLPCSGGGWVGFVVVVIASSRRLWWNDVVSGLGFQGLPSDFISFSDYFEIDKHDSVWTGPNQACPVHDCQSRARSSPTFRLDRTGLSPTPDPVRLHWWNHWSLECCCHFDELDNDPVRQCGYYVDFVHCEFQEDFVLIIPWDSM